MPDKKQKVVKVDGIGTVTFPGDMEDEHIVRAIKSFRSKKKGGLTTEESEHARQLKTAQPLSTAIPSLPDWVNKPLATNAQEFEEKHPDLYGFQLARDKANADLAAKFQAAHPTIGGIEQGVTGFAQGMTSPANLALMLGAPESKILSGIFATQAMRGSFRDAQSAKQAFNEGKNQEAMKYVTQALLGASVGALAGTHAYSGLPEGLRTRLASEEGSVGPQEGGSERRANPELRKRIDEMTPEEMRKILKTSDVVDLPNKRSFLEDQHFTPMPFVARSDADGLKAFNDKFGYEKGDELLRAKADALKEAGLNAYHEKGDEFLYRGKSDKELAGRLEKAREILRNKVFDVTLDDGTHVQLKGVDFSYGTGKDLKEAEQIQHAHKAEREAAGKRKRGELVGLTQVGSEANREDSGTAQGGAAAPIAEIKKQAETLKPTTAYQAIDQSQPFYLKSENLINEKMKGPMAAEDVHKMLLSNGVKPEEMQWTGLDELLKGKGKQKITPQEIQEHLAGNNLQLHEVVKGVGGLVFHNSFPTQEALMQSVKGDEMLVNPDGTLKKGLSIEHSNSGWNIYDSSTKENPTKFGSYVIPGAEPGSYRELLLTMPPRTPSSPKLDFEQADTYQGEPVYKASLPSGGTAYLHHNPGFPWRVDLPDGESKGGFKTAEEAMESVQNDTRYNPKPQSIDYHSSHWEEPNVLGHVRFNDRKGPNGEKILHIEEFQSDLHQSGRKKGYGNAEEIKHKQDSVAKAQSAYSDLDRKMRKAESDILAAELFDKPVDIEKLREEARFLKGARGSALESLRRSKWDLESAVKNAVPDAPFKKTWPELLLKRILKYASDHGDSPALQNLRKPESVRELSNNIFGRKMTLAMPLEHVDGGVLSALKHDQVKKAVISLLPVDVVNDLKAAQLSPDDIFRNPNMLVARLSPDHLGKVARSVLAGSRSVAASLRAKLNLSFATGSDKELFPTLFAHDLKSREIVGLLSPELIYHNGALLGTVGDSGTSSGTKLAQTSSDSTGENIERIPTNGTQFLNTTFVTPHRAEMSIGATRPNAKGSSASITDLLNWHNQILSKSGISNQEPYTAGYSGISWTPGEEQAARYDLSKYIDTIDYNKTKDGKYRIAAGDKTGHEQVLDGTYSESELPDVVGKEVAQKIVNGEGQPGGGRMTLRNVDLKVGGSGMKGFYDKIIPDAANKLGKQWGVKVGKIDLNTGRPTSGPGWEQEPMWDTIARDGRLGKMPLYAIFDEGGNWMGTTGDPESGAVQPGEHVVQVADENGNLLKHVTLPSKSKTVPYLPLHPQAKAGIKSVPYSLFGAAGAALGLQSIKQKADDLQRQFRQAGLAR